MAAMTACWKAEPPPSEVPPVRPGLYAMMVICRLLTSCDAASERAVRRLESFEAGYARAGESFVGWASDSGSSVLGPSGIFLGSCVSLVVITIRPPSAISGSSSRASR